MPTASAIMEYSSAYFIFKKSALDASIGLYEPYILKCFMSNSTVNVPGEHTTLTSHKTHFYTQQASTIMAEAVAMI